MAMKNTKLKQDPQTRQTLIAAGIQLIAEKGYDGASIGDIAGLANVTKGAFYYHFGSKENFALEIIQQRAEKNLARFKQIDRDNISLADWIAHSFSMIIGFSDPAHQLFSLQVMMAGIRPRHEKIAVLGARIHAEWRRLITEMIEASDDYRRGQLLGDPEIIAVAVMALIDGLLIHSRVEPESFTENAFINRLTPLLKLWVLHAPAKR